MQGHSHQPREQQSPALLGRVQGRGSPGCELGSAQHELHVRVKACGKAVEAGSWLRSKGLPSLF